LGAYLHRCVLFAAYERKQRVIVWLGTACFGAVLGWVCATVYRRGRPAWRELEVLIAIVLGALLQSSFGKGWGGAIAYAWGLVAGAVLCQLVPGRGTVDVGKDINEQ
jgi:hypothetical protein